MSIVGALMVLAAYGMNKEESGGNFMPDLTLNIVGRWLGVVATVSRRAGFIWLEFAVGRVLMGVARGMRWKQ